MKTITRPAVAPPLRISVNHSGATPVARQIRAQILAYIRTHRLGPDTRLPSERDLAAANRLNVVSVAKAFRMLVDEGVLRRSVGRGTFVHTDRVSGTICFLNELQPVSQGSMFSLLQQSILTQLFHAAGFQTEGIELAVSPDGTAALADRHLAAFSAGRFAGVIIFNTDLPPVLTDVLRERGIPVIAVDVVRPLSYFDTGFFVDYRDFFRRAVSWLRAAQKCRPLYVGVAPVFAAGTFAPPATFLEREFQRARFAGGPESFLQLSGYGHQAGAFAAVRSWLERSRGYDAVICSNDIISEAIQLSLLCDRRGGKITLVTHANRHLERQFVIPTKKYFVDPERIGQLVVRRMRALIGGKGSPAMTLVPVPFSEDEAPVSDP